VFSWAVNFLLLWNSTFYRRCNRWVASHRIPRQCSPVMFLKCGPLKLCVNLSLRVRGHLFVEVSEPRLRMFPPTAVLLPLTETSWVQTVAVFTILARSNTEVARFNSLAGSFFVALCCCTRTLLVIHSLYITCEFMQTGRPNTINVKKGSCILRIISRYRK
jgi:hypothetical protein